MLTEHLQAMVADGRADISTNDAIAALVWVVCTQLRGRKSRG